MGIEVRRPRQKLHRAAIDDDLARQQRFAAKLMPSLTDGADGHDAAARRLDRAAVRAAEKAETAGMDGGIDQHLRAVFGFEQSPASWMTLAPVMTTKSSPEPSATIAP